MADIFISYARASQRQAEIFEQALSDLGYTVWRDTAALPIHRPYQPEIEANLRAARAVLVLWSKEAAASDWVRAEADLARSEHKLLQVSLDGGLPPMPFNQTQCADFSHWRGDTSSPAWLKLMAGLSALLASEPPPTPTATKRRWRARLGGRLVAVAAAAAVLAFSVGTWLTLGRPGWPQASDVSPAAIAVMPFQTSAGEPLERTFAHGVAEEVAIALAKADLRTVSQDESLPTAPAARLATAQRLGARFALDGLVERAAGRLVVNVHMDDLRVHNLVWSARFDRPDTAAQAMQEQVAAKIADVAHCALDANGLSGGRFDTDAIGLYLKACDLAHDPDAQDQARDLLRQVVGRQPGFAGAWTTLALADVYAINTGDLPEVQSAALRREAGEAADRALALDPKDGTAYAVRYDLEPVLGHWAERQALIAKGLALAPENVELLKRQEDLDARIGRTDEADNYAQRVMALDPLSPDKTIDAAQRRAFNDELGEALAILDRAARLWPDNRDVWLARLGIVARQGDPNEALALLDKASDRPPGVNPGFFPFWREVITARKAHDPAATAALAKKKLAVLVALGARDEAHVVLDLTTIGAVDAAFEALSHSNPDEPLDTEVLFRPYAAGLRRDPRFMPLAARLGLVAYWKATNRWPDFCLALPDRPAPYDCRAVAARLS